MSLSAHTESTTPSTLPRCSGRHWLSTRRGEFAREPDAWLIAFAIAKGCTVVTLEKRESHAKRRVPIPNVCEAFGVRYIDTFQLLRELQIRWELP